VSATDAAAASSRGGLGSAKLVAAGILASRAAGLVRQKIFAGYFGVSIYADAFNAALRMPNVLQNLLGEGTLSASFIPVYSELLHHGRKEEAGRVAGAIFALLVALAAALSLVGIALAPVLVDIGYAGFEGERRELTILCTRIIFPMAGVLVLSAWTLGILNSHRRFFLPYVAPVLWNAAMIAAMLFFGSRSDQRDLLVIVAWGALIGGALQFLVQLPAVLRLERELKVRFTLGLPDVRVVLRNAGPAITGRGVVQLSGWLDWFLASFMSLGAVAALSYAQTLYILPVSLFGMSLAAAELPELARERAGAIDNLRNRINGGLRQVALLVVPSAVGYILLGDIVIGALYQGGEFGRGDLIIVWWILGAYSVGLIASTATRLYSSSFFALRDTRTPARVAILRVGIAGLVGVAVTLYIRFVNPDFSYWGPVVLAGGTGIAAWIEWMFLRSSLREKVAGVGIGRAPLVQLLSASILAAAFGRGIAWLTPGMNSILRAVVVLGPFVIAYFGLARLFGFTEAGSIVRRLIRR